MQFIAAKRRNGRISECSIKDKRLANTVCTKPKQLSVLQDTGCYGAVQSTECFGHSKEGALGLTSSLKCRVGGGSSELLLQQNIKWGRYQGTQIATTKNFFGGRAEEGGKRRGNRLNR